MAKMFRWLKDRKKQKRSEDKTKKDDDYGFQNKHKQQHSDYYGFNDTHNRMFNSESPYHIYEEINDLPDLPMCSESSLQRSDMWHSSNDLRTSRVRNLNPRDEGPYMVVPINIQNNLCIDRRNSCECPATNQRRSSEGDVSNTTFSVTDESPLCTCMQRSNAVGIFKCICKDRSITSASNSDKNYADPWDTSNSSGESMLSSLSEYDLSRLKAIQRSKRHCNKPSSRLDSSNSDTYSQSSKCSSRSRTTAEQEADDTGCEYDMSASSESDVSDYKTSLEKIEHNLILKQQVRKIIKSLSNNDCELSEDSSNNCDRSDLDSTTTVSASASGRSSSVRTVSCSEASDADVFADQSESDDSSGYYECSDDKQDIRLAPETNNSAITSTEVKCSVESKSSDSGSIRELILLPTRVSHKKQKHIKSRSKKGRSEKDLSNILEDTEMYLLPTSRRTSECSDIRVYRKPLLPPQSVPIYQDPYRSKTEGIRNNRLLSDLIRMNNDRQHMIHV